MSSQTLDWHRVRETFHPDSPQPHGYTYRAQVPGGWLVCFFAGTPDRHGQGGGLTFVPDAEHSWLLDEVPSS